MKRLNNFGLLGPHNINKYNITTAEQLREDIDDVREKYAGYKEKYPDKYEILEMECKNAEGNVRRLLSEGLIK